MEGAAVMGDLEIIKLNSGERTIFQTDGSVIKDQVDPPKVEFCDRCQAFKQLEFGRFEGSQGLTMLWFCMECK